MHIYINMNMGMDTEVDVDVDIGLDVDMDRDMDVAVDVDVDVDKDTDVNMVMNSSRTVKLGRNHVKLCYDVYTDIVVIMGFREIKKTRNSAEFRAISCKKAAFSCNFKSSTVMLKYESTELHGHTTAIPRFTNVRGKGHLFVLLQYAYGFIHVLYGSPARVSIPQVGARYKIILHLVFSSLIVARDQLALLIQ
jgi:hypothetical protein